MKQLNNNIIDTMSKFIKKEKSNNANMDCIYPLTVIKDRYSGLYSGGKYIAFNKEYYEVHKAVNGNDDECINFWECYSDIVGKGNTPKEAIENLLESIETDIIDKILLLGDIYK